MLALHSYIVKRQALKVPHIYLCLYFFDRQCFYFPNMIYVHHI